MKGADDRRRHCEEQFERAGIEVTFVRGFNGRESRLRHEQDWISMQVGACISHITAVEEVRHNNLGLTTIFEDDVILCNNFNEQLNKALYTIPNDWHVAALAWFGNDKNPPVFKNINATWQQLKGGDVWGQAAYIINGAAGAEAVLNCITPVRSHIDRMFWECCRDGLMTGYFLKEPLVMQSWDFKSQNV